MANPFTYLCWDLTTATAIDDLPFTAVSFGEKLNAAGPWQGSLPLASPAVQAMNWSQATQPSKTALFVDFLGTLVWGGIIWTTNYQKSDASKSLKVGAQTFGSYFGARLQALDYSNTWSTGADPMVIAQRILNDAMTRATVFGGITVVLNPVGGEAGQQISPSYPGTSLQTIDSILSTLSQMGYTLGFDFSFDCAYVTGTRTPAVTLNFWYPRQGRTYDQSQLMILGSDCIDYTYPVDGTQQATSLTETGSGTGGIQPAVVSASLPGYPLLERTIARSLVNDEGVLANIAFGDLGLYCYPVVTPTVTIPITLPDSSGKVAPGIMNLGQFRLGDDAMFRIDPVAGGGENTDPRFPNGMSFEWRITSWTATIPDTGVPTLMFDLTVPPLGSVPPPQPPL